MKFLIQNNVFPENQERWIDTLNEMKIEHTVWDIEGRPHYKAADNHVFFIGNIISALKLKMVGASFQTWLGPEFDYSYFGSHLNNLLNNDFTLFSHGQLVNELANVKGATRSNQAYMRSNSGYKKFQGGLYCMDGYLVESSRENIQREDIIVFAEKKAIGSEYRLVIRSKYDEISGLWEHAVVTHSSYTDDSFLSPAEIKTIQDDLNTSTYRPYPLWVLDVARTKTGEVKVVEANSINTAGLYNCDLKLIVEEILKIEKEEIQ